MPPRTQPNREIRPDRTHFGSVVGYFFLLIFGFGSVFGFHYEIHIQTDNQVFNSVQFGLIRFWFLVTVDITRSVNASNRVKGWWPD